jgi:oligopeptidase A
MRDPKLCAADEVAHSNQPRMPESQTAIPMHPFLTSDFHLRWSTLDPKHIEADIEIALQQAQAGVDAVADQDRGRITFDSVIIALDEATKVLDDSWSIVDHLDSLADSEALREAHGKMLPKVSAFSAKIPLNAHLWDLIETYSKTDEAKALTGVRARCLKETMARFRNAGADLEPDKKARFEAIQGELAQLTQKYKQNVLDSTNAFELILDDAHRLAGLPESAIDAARADALAKGHGSDTELKYRFTLKQPSLTPVMQYAEDSDLRKELWQGSATVGRSGEHDNTDLIWQILGLRQEKAELLGKANFADLVLELRMAKTGQIALDFTEQLHAKTKAAFDKEIIELQEFRADTAHVDHDLFNPWDVGFWHERRRKALFDFDPEELRPYFSVDKVINGMFRLSEQLFGIKLVERDTVFLKPGEDATVSTQATQSGPVEVWDPHVKFYEIHDESGVHLGSFYADWHPRDNKRGGAWMNCLRGGRPPVGNEDRLLHLGLICGNMTPPVDGKPALLTHDEVQTVFHEFGHLIHQLLGNVEIAGMNGVNVAWDFVELPSQFMENFCWERESLDLFARHVETSEPIPAKLFKRMIAARNYGAASAMMRQLGFGKLDLELHIKHAKSESKDLDAIARQITSGYMMPLKIETPTMARRFTHLCADPTGYAAGYYSYKWAEVLDADAFTRFQKEGVLNAKVGREFRTHILSKGNSEDPAKLFRDFMGRDPDPDALLRRDGLAK